MIKLYVDFAPMETNIILINDAEGTIRTRNFFSYTKSSMQMPELVKFIAEKFAEYHVNQIAITGIWADKFKEMLIEAGCYPEEIVIYRMARL